jgi:translin
MTTGSRSSADAVSDDPPIAEATLAALEAHLAEREERREAVYRDARRLRRLAQATVARLHATGDARAELSEVSRGLAALSDAVRSDRRAGETVATDALQEAVEALLFGAVVAGTPLPTPTALGVDPEPYLLGLGDVVGEVRRRLLDALGGGRLADAERLLGRMEALTEALLRFDTSRAIVPLKPKQDQARILLERTRGEVVMARLLDRARPPGGGGR